VNLKALIRNCCPPVLLKLVRQLRYNNNTFTGNYASWIDAGLHASGYDTDVIFQRVRDAALKVKRGEAVFERDSVCFYKDEYRWPALAVNRLKSIRWSVIEQAQFVECGRNEFQNENLKFYTNIDECLANEKVDVVFLSSVLQYLESPHATLSTLTQTGAPYFLIDRTPMHSGAVDRLSIQGVPKNIFPATLAAYIFSEENINLTMAKSSYVRNLHFSCKEDAQNNVDFIGILYGKEAA
jgi:hypothetical protein